MSIYFYRKKKSKITTFTSRKKVRKRCTVSDGCVIAERHYVLPATPDILDVRKITPLVDKIASCRYVSARLFAVEAHNHGTARPQQGQQICATLATDPPDDVARRLRERCRKYGRAPPNSEYRPEQTRYWSALLRAPFFWRNKDWLN